MCDNNYLLFFESKQNVRCLKHRKHKRSKKCYVLIFKKDISKVKNTLLKWILQNISENQTFQRTPKFVMTDFYEMDFMKRTVTLVLSSFK